MSRKTPSIRVFKDGRYWKTFHQPAVHALMNTPRCYSYDIIIEQDKILFLKMNHRTGQYVSRHILDPVQKTCDCVSCTDDYKPPLVRAIGATCKHFGMAALAYGVLPHATLRKTFKEIQKCH